MRHHLVIAELSSDSRDYKPRLDALNEWRAKLPEDWRALVIGPVPAVINQYAWVVLFLPDGSKEGWEDSDQGDAYREEFLSIMGGAVIATWGDDPEPSISEWPDPDED